MLGDLHNLRPTNVEESITAIPLEPIGVAGFMAELNFLFKCLCLIFP